MSLSARCKAVLPSLAVLQAARIEVRAVCGRLSRAERQQGISSGANARTALRREPAAMGLLGGLSHGPQRCATGVTAGHAAGKRLSASRALCPVCNAWERWAWCGRQAALSQLSALITILVPLPDFKVEHPPADAAHSKHYRLNVLCAFDRRKGAASLARWRHGCCTKHVICMAAHAATALVGIGRGRCTLALS
jgi:hypothetical protein